MAANEGQRQLTALGLTLNEVARVCGVSKQAVSGWKSGARVPDPVKRRAIETAYGIAVTAWDAKPGAARKVKKAAAVAPPKASGGRRRIETAPVDRVAELVDLLASVREARRAKNIASQELARLAGAEGTLVDKIARLETMRRSESALLEARIVRDHPTWRRLREALVVALKPHPEAARSVLAAFDQLEAS